MSILGERIGVKHCVTKQELREDYMTEPLDKVIRSRMCQLTAEKIADLFIDVVETECLYEYNLDVYVVTPAGLEVLVKKRAEELIAQGDSSAISKQLENNAPSTN